MFFDIVMMFYYCKENKNSFRLESCYYLGFYIEIVIIVSLKLIGSWKYVYQLIEVWLCCSNKVLDFGGLV